MTAGRRKILVFRIGSLGDSIVALPAIWAIKDQYPDAEMHLLTDHASRFVASSEVYGADKIFTEYLTYDPGGARGGLSLSALAAWSKLAQVLRLHRYDVLAYLVPSERSHLQRLRDWLLFKQVGIPTVLGFNGFFRFPRPGSAAWHTGVPKESDLLLRRVAAAGIPVPADDAGRLDLEITPRERQAVDAWLGTLPSAPEKRWLGVGPGGKKATHLWALDRFGASVSRLIERHDLWPVVFGGQEDRAAAEGLVARWGRGAIAAGSLDIRAGVAALERCAVFIGNDTGTMHMAAAAGCRCVIIQPAVRPSGQWAPYGKHHVVIRPTKGPTIDSIDVDDVVRACERVLG